MVAGLVAEGDGRPGGQPGRRPSRGTRPGCQRPVGGAAAVRTGAARAGFSLPPTCTQQPLGAVCGARQQQQQQSCIVHDGAWCSRQSCAASPPGFFAAWFNSCIR
jgi:hypothetical protein